MNFSEILQQFIEGMHATKWYEYVAVFFGIASVWFSRKENILVYPVGIINTILYVYISFEGSLFGEVAVQVYYTIMSIYGWILWTKKNSLQKPVIVITRSNKKEWVSHLLFFSVFFITFFASLTYLKKEFAPGAIPLADAFASATAFTGMWLMAKKKVESWYWWIATNIASIPLYFVKQYVFTSVYYFILLIMAVWGLIEWTRRANNQSRLLSEQKVIV
ncbi:MAG: nicotinamide riboside transporter PnuC [Chitinophagaceae bacterium]